MILFAVDLNKLVIKVLVILSTLYCFFFEKLYVLIILGKISDVQYFLSFSFFFFNFWFFSYLFIIYYHHYYSLFFKIFFMQYFHDIVIFHEVRRQS